MAISQHRECEKKESEKHESTEVGRFRGFTGDLLATFEKRLRELCENHCPGNGQERSRIIRLQTEHTLALALELGLLKDAGVSWDEFCIQCADSVIGTEHMVELDAGTGLVGKTTIPPAFGLVPEVRSHTIALLAPDSDRPHLRDAIEFLPATPLEYLARWRACNEVFGDAVRLASVILWADGMISFGITQPQYHGVPAEPREIDAFFTEAGWTRLADPSGHTVFFNYAFGLMAIDAERRNCYINDGGLQPFDVILCEPDERMEKFLRIYPG